MSTLLSFDEMHQLIDDAHLDELAAYAGLPSRIGRLSLVPDFLFDAMLERLKERHARTLIDFGCGRGTLKRWLDYKRAEIDYTGIDFSLDAIAAARRAVPSARFIRGDYRTYTGDKTDAIALFDAFFDASMSLQQAQRFFASLNVGGTLFMSMMAFDQPHEREIQRTCLTLRAMGFDVTFEDWTASAEEHALAIAATWVNSPRWHDKVAGLFRDEGRAVIDAISERRFKYATIDAVRAT